MAYITVPKNFFVETEVDRVDGYSGDRKFGRNPDVRSGTLPEDLWGGSGTYPGIPGGTPSGETVEVFSDNSADNQAGTGATEVTLFGLSDTHVPQTEVLPLHATDGTIAVTSSLSWWRLNRVSISGAGSGETNAGDITVRMSTTTSVVFVVVPAEAGQSKVLVITVPAGKTMLLKMIDIYVEAGSPSGVEVGVSLRVLDFESGVLRVLGHFTATRDVPAKIPFILSGQCIEKSDVFIRVDSCSSSQQTIVSGDIQYIFVPQ